MNMNICDWKCRIKNLWKSKTAWFNMLYTAGVTAFAYFSDSYMMLRDYVTPETFQLLALGNFAGNMILRVITTLDLKDK